MRQTKVLLGGIAGGTALLFSFYILQPKASLKWAGASFKHLSDWQDGVISAAHRFYYSAGNNSLGETRDQSGCKETNDKIFKLKSCPVTLSPELLHRSLSYLVKVGYGSIMML